jgi:hypothetical protein
MASLFSLLKLATWLITAAALPEFLTWEDLPEILAIQ